MIKGIRLALFRLLVCAPLLCANAALSQSPPASGSSQVLPLIEKYKAPPYPKTSYLDRETYDYRISSHRPVPATLTDVFICDIWQRVTMDLKSAISPREVSEGIVTQAMGVYLTKDWNDIAGYRPWTHWNFIRGLKPPQRDALVKEITAYISKNGVRDREDGTESRPGRPCKV